MISLEKCVCMCACFFKLISAQELFKVYNYVGKYGFGCALDGHKRQEIKRTQNLAKEHRFTSFHETQPFILENESGIDTLLRA